MPLDSKAPYDLHGRLGALEKLIGEIELRFEEQANFHLETKAALMKIDAALQKLEAERE